MPTQATITFDTPAIPNEGVLAILMDENGQLGEFGTLVDEATDGAIKRAAKAVSFPEKEKTIEITGPQGLSAARILVFALPNLENKEEEIADESFWINFGGRISSKLLKFKDDTLHLVLENTEPEEEQQNINSNIIGLIASGVEMRAYAFDTYMTSEKVEKEEDDQEAEEEKTAFNLSIGCVEIEEAKASYEITTNIAQGVHLARDLISEPSNILTPEEFKNRIEGLEELGIEVEILDKENMERKGMNALLGVAQGSVNAPYVALMHWKGDKVSEAPIALVGKGVTFDTGGISIKPAGGMEDMKADMGGAAAVTGAMRAIAGRKAKANVVGVVGLVENMPDGNAQRPGDIVTSLSGQTIEVINTDAEGRLVLCDMLTYVENRFAPKAMINLATLTGAIIVALGKEYAGLFSNDDDLAGQLFEAGLQSEEKLWRMPLHKGYDAKLKSKFADMKNIGGREAGSITAAQFLQRFVKSTPWAHIDIAGTAMGSPKSDVHSGFTSGFGVRLLDRYIANNYEAK